MPSTFIFCWLELKWRSCDIPFPKSIVYSDVLLDKLGQVDLVFLSQQNREKLNTENWCRAFPLVGLKVSQAFELLETN